MKSYKVVEKYVDSVDVSGQKIKARSENNYFLYVLCVPIIGNLLFLIYLLFGRNPEYRIEEVRKSQKRGLRND
jgi:hypothetical protein